MTSIEEMKEVIEEYIRQNDTLEVPVYYRLETANTFWRWEMDSRGLIVLYYCHGDSISETDIRDSHVVRTYEHIMGALA